MIKRNYLIFFILSFVSIAIANRFSSLLAYLLLMLYGVGLSIPLYTFVREREKSESKKEKIEGIKSKISIVGDTFTYLGVLLVSLITLFIIFKVINFILVIFIMLIKRFIT